MKKFKQYIVINKGLGMSRGKLMVQASHASIAFLMNQMRNTKNVKKDKDSVECKIELPLKLWNGWVEGNFTKICLSVKNESELLELIDKLRENEYRSLEDIHPGENADFFIIRDACLTELSPDETGTRMTCLGFTPTNDKKLMKLLSKYKLYK